MKELELLGLQPDGETLTLNDAEGNRYSLAITDDLRAALRRDRPARSDEPIRQMTPREIQSHVREGLSIEQVCELSLLPYERVDALAHPIIAEREYTASQARSFTLTHDAGALTIEELVASRLLSRAVAPENIVWDAFRKQGEPWTLQATFLTGDREHRATWHVDLESGTLQALDDEAIWLSETQIPAVTSTWRAANTPKADPASLPSPVASSPSAPSPARPAKATREDLESMLASLDSMRGKQRPMPEASEDEEVLALAEDAAEGPTAQGADSSREDAAEDTTEEATILAFPHRSTLELPEADEFLGEIEPFTHEGDGRTGDAGAKSAGTGSAEISPLTDGTSALDSTATEENAGAADGQGAGEATAGSARGDLAQQPTLIEVEPVEPETKKKRPSRPSMPSWDEIVFGKKD